MIAQRDLVVIGAADGGLSALSTLSALEEAGGVALVEDPDAPPSLVQQSQVLGGRSHRARLDRIAPLLAMLVEG